MKRTTGMLVLGLAVTLAGGAQAQGDLLDVYTAKVKPEKRAAFDGLSRKMAEANRKNGGDNWIALAAQYGDQSLVHFISTRRNYGEIDSAMGQFMKALGTAYGEAGTQQLFKDMDATVESTRGEIRRRRPDLSSGFPATPEAYAKMMGEARYVRMLVTRLRPGTSTRWEEMQKVLKQALDKAGQGHRLVSTAVAGAQGTVYYSATLGKSMADFESRRSLREVLGGDTEVASYQKVIAESVIGTESMILRVVPEWSNPPAAVAQVAPSFWTPAKKAAPAKPKSAQ